MSLEIGAGWGKDKSCAQGLWAVVTPCFGRMIGWTECVTCRSMATIRSKPTLSFLPHALYSRHDTTQQQFMQDRY
jgi:hypothetical protein